MKDIFLFILAVLMGISIGINLTMNSPKYTEYKNYYEKNH